MKYCADKKQDRAQEARLEAVGPEPRRIVMDKARAHAVAKAVVDWLYDTGDCLFCTIERDQDGQYIHEDFCPLLGLRTEPDYSGALPEPTAQYTTGVVELGVQG